MTLYDQRIAEMKARERPSASLGDILDEYLRGTAEIKANTTRLAAYKRNRAQLTEKPMSTETMIDPYDGD